MRGAIAACVAFSAGAAAAIIFYKRSAIKRLAKKAGRPAAKGASDKHFAGRYALGKNMPVLHKKNGFKLEREDGAIRLLGGACGECLGGANLAELLAEGFEIESRAMEALAQNKPAETLSVHTSAGVPTQLDEFIAALKRHLPMADGDDWCVNLQSEGASAVHAAVDMCLQAFHSGELNVPGGRCKLACGASSYHGPASTSPGGATPLGAAAKGLTHPVRYPVPTPFLRHKGESVDKFHARLLSEFGQYLDTYANEIGVLLVEPQWGSSVAAMPWPPKLLKAYIAAAKERGIAVVCDEVMCGLGRHGAEPNGGTGCFLSECWDLQPDCVTFGKAIGGGAGHLLSGAILLHSASKLKGTPHGTALQSHTYCGSSARALANGTALLEALPSWRPSIRAIGAAIKPTVDKINDPNGPYKGCMTAHGQGAMWGGMFTHSDPKARAKANLDFKKRCLAKGLLPYFVPVGGFMLTPRYDDDAAELGAAVAEMAGCALETIQAMGWQPSELLPQPAKAAKPSPGPRVFAAAPLEAAAAAQRSKATGAGTISAREAKVACLATAYAAKAPAEWMAHVSEARKAGLEDEHISSLARGATPAFDGGSREAAVYLVAAEMISRMGRVAEETYTAGVAAVGEKGMQELVSVVGAAMAAALTTNTFEVAASFPAGVNPKAPWESDRIYVPLTPQTESMKKMERAASTIFY